MTFRHIPSYNKHRPDSVLTSNYLIESSLHNLESLINFKLKIKQKKEPHDPFIDEIVSVCHFNFPKI